jgi:glycine cleavage system transcriptional repressor
VTKLALSALGRDRPGIVARVTERLVAEGVSVEDSQMAILRGHFTMMLILDTPAGLDVDRLRGELEAAAAELELEALALSEVAELAVDTTAPTHVVTVYGADHVGILHAVAAALAGAGVNITDLSTRLIDEEGEVPVYVIMLEVAAGEADVERTLAPVREAQGVEVSVRVLELDPL